MKNNSRVIIKPKKIYMIVSKDGQLIFKGSSRNKSICHTSEKNRKRFLAYSSRKKAENGISVRRGLLSEIAIEHIKEYYPELINEVN